MYKNNEYYLNKIEENVDFIIAQMDGVSKEQLEENPVLQEAATAIDQYIDCLFTGFSKDERQEMARYFDRICENAETELQNMEEGKLRCTS